MQKDAKREMDQYLMFDVFEAVSRCTKTSFQTDLRTWLQRIAVKLLPRQNFLLMNIGELPTVTTTPTAFFKI